MLETTQEYRDAIVSDVRVIHASFTLNNQTYDKSHLKKIEHDASISGGSSFVPGGTFINSLSVELNQIVEGIEERASVFKQSTVKRQCCPLVVFLLQTSSSTATQKLQN